MGRFGSGWTFATVWFRTTAVVSAAIASAALGGCSSGASGNQTATAKDVVASDASQADSATPPDAGGKVDGKGGDTTTTTPVTEDFWVVYGRRSRQPGAAATDNDVVLTSWKNPAAAGNAGAFGTGVSPLDPKLAAIQLTKYAFKQAGGLTCNFGCLFSQDLKYIAIAKGAPGTDGYDFQLGTLNGQLQVFLGKFGVLSKVAHLQFAQGYLFYSTQAGCLGTGKCQYDIHRRGMDDTTDLQDVVITRMAPDDDPDVVNSDTTYNGYFQVSDDASTVVFLTTTIRSMKVYTWRGGNVSKQDYICENPLGDTCVGTGSQYHDNDPIAVSQDGKTLVLFTIIDRWLRARLYHVGSEEASSFSNLMEVPNGKGGASYLQNACAALQPWQHAEVKSQPMFSADGKLVYYVGYSDCATPSDKVWTDLMALPVAKIGGQIAKGDLLNLTNNPRDNSTKNKRIYDFSMSPQRQVFLLSASATVQADGQPIPDGGARAMQDSEIYTMIVGDSGLVPVTNELLYAADAPRAVLPVAP